MKAASVILSALVIAALACLGCSSDEERVGESDQLEVEQFDHVKLELKFGELTLPTPYFIYPSLRIRASYGTQQVSTKALDQQDGVYQFLSLNPLTIEYDPAEPELELAVVNDGDSQVMGSAVLPSLSVDSLLLGHSGRFQNLEINSSNSENPIRVSWRVTAQLPAGSQKARLGEIIELAELYWKSKQAIEAQQVAIQQAINDSEVSFGSFGIAARAKLGPAAVSALLKGKAAPSTGYGLIPLEGAPIDARLEAYCRRLKRAFVETHTIGTTSAVADMKPDLKYIAQSLAAEPANSHSIGILLALGALELQPPNGPLASALLSECETSILTQREREAHKLCEYRIVLDCFGPSYVIAKADRTRAKTDSDAFAKAIASLRSTTNEHSSRSLMERLESSNPSIREAIARIGVQSKSPDLCVAALAAAESLGGNEDELAKLKTLLADSLVRNYAE